MVAFFDQKNLVAKFQDFLETGLVINGMKLFNEHFKDVAKYLFLMWNVLEYRDEDLFEIFFEVQVFYSIK
jgi:hypothetical protein